MDEPLDIFSELEAMALEMTPSQICAATTAAAAIAKPAAAKPTAAKPAAAKPTVAKPTAAKPTVAKLAAAKLATTKPVAAEAGSAEDEHAEPPAYTPTEEITPLMAIFLKRNIHIMGTVDDPMFCVTDVAQYIGDTDYRNVLKKFASIFARQVASYDVWGRRREMWYFTEIGLYRYLLQSKREEALSFQMFTYDLLKAERKRTVDELQLAVRLEKARSEQLEREKAFMQREKAYMLQEENELMRAANIARERVKKLTKVNSGLMRQKHAAADAEEIRLCGRQVEQIPGWNC